MVLQMYEKLEVVPAYLKGAASTWWNANQALPNNDPNKIVARQQPGEDVNTYAAALQELYRRVETNAFAYPEAIKLAYELTHQDQHAVNAYLNKFAPAGTSTQTEDLYKAIQDLTRQVQQLSTGNRGYRGNNYRNPQQVTPQPQQSLNRRIVCYSCGQPGHIVRNCPDRNNNTTSVANNGEGRSNPQPTSVGNSNNNQLAQLQQLLAQLVLQETDKDQSLN
ncbi:unnamed protein product [Rhizophagus irregularis]|nr:unnamed protein product [Rhizophagus irregularis]